MFTFHKKMTPDTEWAEQLRPKTWAYVGTNTSQNLLIKNIDNGEILGEIYPNRKKSKIKITACGNYQYSDI